MKRYVVHLAITVRIITFLLAMVLHYLVNRRKAEHFVSLGILFLILSCNDKHDPAGPETSPCYSTDHTIIDLCNDKTYHACDEICVDTVIDFPIKDQHPNSYGFIEIVVDSKGVVWALNGYDLFRITENVVEDFSDFMASHHVKWFYGLYVDDRDNLWLANSSKIYKYNGSQWSVLSIDEETSDFTVFQDTVYVALDHVTGIIKRHIDDLEGKHETYLEFPDEPSLRFSTDDIQVTENGNIWISKDNLVLWYDGKNWTVFDHTLTSMDEDDWFKELTLGINNEVWAITGRGKMYRFSESGVKEIDLGKNFVSSQSLYVDRKGYLWLEHGSLSCFEPESLKEYQFDYSLDFNSGCCIQKSNFMAIDKVNKRIIYPSYNKGLSFISDWRD